MKCNIRTCDRNTKEVQCYKTKYKNVVIAKLDEHCYSITHWQTGIALSFDRYKRKKDAMDDLPEVIEKVRKTNVNIKQFCKKHKLKQINF